MTHNNSTEFYAPFREGEIYHIYNRGINGCQIFSSDRNKEFFYKRMNRYLNSYVEILAWVFMGNHFHLVVKVNDIDLKFLRAVFKEKTKQSAQFLEKQEINPFIIDQFKRWLNSYAKAYNKEQGRTGSLFEKRFKRIKVKNEKQLDHLIAYIHNNPVHHGIVTEPSDWLYSSYQRPNEET